MSIDKCCPLMLSSVGTAYKNKHIVRIGLRVGMATFIYKHLPDLSIGINLRICAIVGWFLTRLFEPKPATRG